MSNPRDAVIRAARAVTECAQLLRGAPCPYCVANLSIALENADPEGSLSSPVTSCAGVARAEG